MAKKKVEIVPLGRPAVRSDGIARTRTLGIRLTEEEEAAIVAATPAGLPPSVWLRQIALAAAARRTKK